MEMASFSANVWDLNTSLMRVLPDIHILRLINVKKNDRPLPLCHFETWLWVLFVETTDALLMPYLGDESGQA